MYGSASGPEKIGDCSILIPNSISDKVGFWPIHCAMLVDISAARTHDEWVNIDEHKRCTRAIFSCYCWRVGGEKRREEAPFGSPGTEEPLSIFRIFPVKFRKRYQSHFETPGLHLFVRDAERCSDDCANSSNPTYSRSSHKTHTHTHTHTHLHTTHCTASATFHSLCVPGIFCGGVCSVALEGLDWGSSLSSVGSWELRIKNTPWLFGQKQHESILDKWVSFSMSHPLKECARVCVCVCLGVCVSVCVCKRERVSKMWWYVFFLSIRFK